MPFILNIDTSQNGLYISISKAGICLAQRTDDGATNQATLLNVFVQEVMQEASVSFTDLQAVSVLKGPGSYTGLRIGLASAKGFCMALDIPLIAIDNLQALVQCYVAANKVEAQTIVPVFIPMANEIIFAKYVVQNKMLMNTVPTSHSKMVETLALKSDEIIIKSSTNKAIIEAATMVDVIYDKAIINAMAHTFFVQKQFADLISTLPNYVKEAYIQEAKK